MQLRLFPEPVLEFVRPPRYLADWIPREWWIGIRIGDVTYTAHAKHFRDAMQTAFEMAEHDILQRT